MPVSGNKDAKGQGFDGNPQNINRTGANRKSWSSINKKLKEQGVESVSRDTYYETVSRIMNLNQDEMRDMVGDNNTPQWLRWLIGDLSDKKIRAKIMSEYRDWMFGKAAQKVEGPGKDGEITIKIDGLGG